MADFTIHLNVRELRDRTGRPTDDARYVFFESSGLRFDPLNCTVCWECSGLANSRCQRFRYSSGDSPSRAAQTASCLKQLSKLALIKTSDCLCFSFTDRLPPFKLFLDSVIDHVLLILGAEVFLVAV